MDPVTLHFNVFQAGEHSKHSLQVDDPRRTTIFALKEQLFSDDIKASKSVRFIAAGKILADADALERYKLGNEAHIHVSISDGGSSPSRSGVPSGDSTSASPTHEAKGSVGFHCPAETVESPFSWAFIVGAVAFVSTGAMIYGALIKRRQLTMHQSQLLFILAAIWGYLLICHGLPALVEAMSKLGSSPASKDPSSRSLGASGVTSAAGVGDEASSASSSAAPPPAASPSGLSLMTPALPSGDAIAASGLTQRR